MKQLASLLLGLLFLPYLKAQEICHPDGNVMIYSNYDGGYLTIDVDTDIPDLKIGIVSYHASDVTITGAFAANVTGVIYAGFNQIADGCAGGDIPETVVTGVAPDIVTYHSIIDGDPAIASYLGDDFLGVPLVNCMVSGSGCEETSGGGGNSSPQIVQFFLSEFDDDDVFYAHWTDYGCWPGGDFLVSEGGNCCLEDPVTDPNPIYVEGADYDFFGADTLALCDGDTVLDISYYPTIYGDPEWSTGESGYSITVTGEGVYSFIMNDYCYYGDNYLTDTLVIEACSTTIDTAICEGDVFVLPDGTTTDEEGTYEIILVATDGSDSIVVVNLSWIIVLSTTVDAEVCEGEIYLLPDGEPATTTGTYTTVLSSIDGCDSTIITNLEVIPPALATAEDSFCPGSSYILPDGTEVTTAGDYEVLLTTVSGCDSLLTLSLTLSDTLEVLVAGIICEGDTYTLEDGTVVDEPGTYEALLFPPDVACVTRFTTTLEVTDSVFTSEEDVFCPGSSYVLPDGTSVSDAGSYTLFYTTAAGCDSVHTINLSLSDTLEVNTAVNICEGASYMLEDGTSVDVAGVYEVVLFPPDVDCITRYITTLNVETPADITMPVDAVVCLSDPAFPLNAEPLGGTFSGTGVSGTLFDPMLAGVGGPYLITYTYTSPLGCTSSATTSFTVTENYAEAGADVTILMGDSVVLNVFTEGIPVWSPEAGLSCTACFNPVASPVETTTYTVTSEDEGGCIATDQVTVFVEPLPDPVVFVPNSFTPNGDGLNDFFSAYGPDLDLVIEMVIYDRWGSVVFRGENLDPNDANAGWDGTKNAAPVKAGVYAYTMALLFRGGTEQLIQGNVTLLR